MDYKQEIDIMGWSLTEEANEYLNIIIEKR